MKYVALYSGRAYYEAMSDAAEWAESDAYYRSPAGRRDVTVDGDTYRCGCTGVHRERGEVLPQVEDIIQCLAIRWVSSGGNLAEYQFDHQRQQVCLCVVGRRHGLCTVRLTDFEADEVLEYSTREPGWKWWETRDTNTMQNLPVAAVDAEHPPVDSANGGRPYYG